MNIAIIATNMIKISENTAKGTEIFVRIFANNLKKYLDSNNLDIHPVLFSSGDTNVDIPIRSINPIATLDDPDVKISLAKQYELALISEAFSQNSKFDLYHVHISNGEWVMPLARLIKKPVLITMHGGDDDAYHPDYFTLFKNNSNIHFVSISESQKKRLPNVNHIKTIYHGIDLTDTFTFNSLGGDKIMWAGRAVPDKGLDLVLDTASKTKRPVNIFPIIKAESIDWLTKNVLRRRSRLAKLISIHIDMNMSRMELVQEYQKAKLFLSPTSWEEPFGLVLAESMASGTPIVAFARGSVPEIVADGISGFIVNSSDEDIRGDYIIKKTGVAGLAEAIEKIYSMTTSQYLSLRKSTRVHAEKMFDVKRMISQYIEIYQDLARSDL